MKDYLTHPFLDENINKLMIYLITLSAGSPLPKRINDLIHSLNEVLKNPNATIQDFNQNYATSIPKDYPGCGSWIVALNKFIKSSKNDAVIDFSDVDQILSGYANNKAVLSGNELVKLKKLVGYVLETVTYDSSSIYCAKQAKALMHLLNNTESGSQYVHTLMSFCFDMKDETLHNLVFKSLMKVGRNLFKYNLQHAMNLLDQLAFKSQKRTENLDNVGLFAKAMSQPLLQSSVYESHYSSSLKK